MLKMGFYIVAVAVMYILIKDTDFLHWSLGGGVARIDVFDHYPCEQLPRYLPEWYLVKLGYYSHEMLFHLAYHRQRHDFTEIMLHHFLTNVLVWFSYSTSALKIGSIVMLTHDFSDIWVANMKIVFEFQGKLGQLCAYLLMFCSFVYTRLVVFPFVIIRQFYERYTETSNPLAHRIFWVLESFLCCLLMLHVFWTTLMLKGLYREASGRDKEYARKEL